MGIRHLQTFMVNNVPEGYIQVSLVYECTQYSRANNGQKPVLVIDLMGVLSILNKDKVDLLYGGRHNKYFHIIDNLFRRLSEMAVLVFFKDGSVVEEKTDTWIERQDTKYKDCEEVMDLVDQNVPIKSIIDKQLIRNKKIPTVTTHQELIGKLAKTYGTRITTVTKECDAELARYASSTPGVIAVLADDSDFLIFSGSWRYFSIEQLNIDTLKTMEFSKTALRAHLRLSDKQLIIFSTVAGNDIVKHDEVKWRHRDDFGGHLASVKFPAIARFIREEVDLRNFNEMVHNLADYLLSDTTEFTKKRIIDSLAQYNIKFQPVEENDSPLLRACLQHSQNWVYNILRERPTNITLVYYDMRRTEWPDIFQISMRIFKRSAGIVLQHRRSVSGPEIRCKVLAKRSQNEGFEPHFVTPEYPDILIPPLIELLNRDNFPQHDDIRFHLMKWSISDKMVKVEFEKIPRNYLRIVATLYFLICEGYISVLEADLLLLSVKHVELDSIPENLVYPPVVSARAFRIAFLFCKSFSNIGRALKITGLKHYKKFQNLDGVFFHKTYLDFMASGNDPAPLLADIDEYRMYKSLSD